MPDPRIMPVHHDDSLLFLTRPSSPTPSLRATQRSAKPQRALHFGTRDQWFSAISERTDAAVSRAGNGLHETASVFASG